MSKNNNKTNPAAIAQLKQLIQTGEAEQVVAFFNGMSEEERRSWSPQVVKLVKESDLSLPNAEGVFYFHDPEGYRTAILKLECAILATANMTEIRKGYKRIFPGLNEFSEKSVILAFESRKPDWIVEFVIDTMHYDQPMNHQEIWYSYQSWLNAGVSPRLLDEAVVYRMIQAMANNGPLMETIPEEFSQEFWFILEHQFRTPYWFTLCDTAEYSDRVFNKTFVRWTEEKRIDRRRLLDATLASLNFSYSDYEMRWYSNLYRMLQPNAEEKKDCERRYYELLGDRNSSTVALAFEMIMELEKEKQLDDKLFLESVFPIFGEKPKARSKKALQLAAKIAKRRTDLRATVLQTALAGLQHREGDVQSEAVKILSQYLTSADSEAIGTIAELLPTLAATVRPQLHSILPQRNTTADTDASVNSGSQSTSTNEITDRAGKSNDVRVANNIEITPRDFGPLDISRLETLAPLTMPRDLDEMFDLAFRVLDCCDKYDEYERLLYGFALYYNTAIPDMKTKTSPIRKVLKKTEEREWSFSHSNTFEIEKYRGLLNMIPAGAALLLKAIVADEFVYTEGSGDISIRMEKYVWNAAAVRYSIPEGIFRRRVLETIRRVIKGIVLVPLAIPTHEGGWIDPLVLAQRIIDAGSNYEYYDQYDKISSLYRLPIDHRCEALKILKSVSFDDPYLKTLRLILGKSETLDQNLPDEYRVALETDIALRSRRPLFEFNTDYIPRRTDRARDGFLTDTTGGFHGSGISNVKLDIPASPNRLYYPLFNQYRDFEEDHFENKWLRAAFQWYSWLVPAVQDPFYWRGMRRMLEEQENGTGWAMNSIFIEPLLDSNQPMTFPGALAVFLFLAFKSDSPALVAQDVLIQSIGDGRLGVTLAVRAARYWIDQELEKRVRWAKRFENIAAVSLAHANIVRQIIESILPCLKEKEVGSFIAVLSELCALLDKKVENETCREFLKSITGSGKAAKLAKKIL